MKISTIAIDRLLATVEHIRNSPLPAKTKRDLVDQIMRDCDLIRRIDSEHLLCIKHTKELRGYANHSSIYRQLPRLPLHIYNICCKTFYDRRELEALPAKDDYTTRVIKVGMSGR